MSDQREAPVRSVEIVVLLVVVATTVAAFAHRLRVPAPSLLVLAGLLVALIPGVPPVRIAPNVVSLVVLPPLLYAAGQDLSWRELRPVWRPVTILALGLVVASAAAVGAVAVAVTPLSTSMAFVLGAVLASTDPVAVTALGRRLALPARVHSLIQAESLFNDATSLVLFRVAVGVAVAGGTVPWGRAAGDFVLVGGGGALAGAAVAGGVALIRARTEDPVVETVIALVTPYAGYLVAEQLHVSGITAVVVASVILAGQATRLSNAQIRLQLHAVYGTVTFLLESVVFGLIGLALPTLIRQVGGQVPGWVLPALAITATLLAVRALWVFPLSMALQWRRDGQVSWRVPAVVSWAGARGVLPLAAALSIPLAARHGGALAGRDLAVLLTTAVIVITLLVQGFTLGPLVRRSGVALPAGHGRTEQSAARAGMARVALAHLDEVEGLDAAAPAVVAQLRELVRARLADAREGSDEALGPALRQLRRDLIAVEAEELTRLYEDGVIGAGTRRQLQRRLDLEESSLAD
jgi:CPA1 family monovalent cation:H+ antiporter